MIWTLIRQTFVPLQAEEAKRLRKRKKAESMRLLDMQRRQKERIEEVRETQKKVGVMFLTFSALYRRYFSHGILPEANFFCQSVYLYHNQDEENMNTKEKLRAEIMKGLNKLEMTCVDMASLLRCLGIEVGGGFKPSPHEASRIFPFLVL